jgi:hypothetical protein
MGEVAANPFTDINMSPITPFNLKRKLERTSAGEEALTTLHFQKCPLYIINP